MIYYIDIDSPNRIYWYFCIISKLVGMLKRIQGVQASPLVTLGKPGFERAAIEQADKNA